MADHARHPDGRTRPDFGRDPHRPFSGWNCVARAEFGQPTGSGLRVRLNLGCGNGIGSDTVPSGLVGHGGFGSDTVPSGFGGKGVGSDTVPSSLGGQGGFGSDTVPSGYVGKGCFGADTVPSGFAGAGGLGADTVPSGFGGKVPNVPNRDSGSGRADDASPVHASADPRATETHKAIDIVFTSRHR